LLAGGRGSRCRWTSSVSNFTLAQALTRRRSGILPGDIGSDLIGRNPGSPDRKSARRRAVLAVKPTISPWCVRARGSTNAVMWGASGIRPGARHSPHLKTAGEIVPPRTASPRPNRVVSRASSWPRCEARWGAHPSPVQGFYRRDHEAYADYHRQTKTKQGYDAWRAEWVDGVPDLQGYVARLGNERVAALIPLTHHLAEPVDYGY
jgi:glutaconate CoA-transferase subunit A